MNFIDSLLADTEGIETPRKFIKWAAISAISAANPRNVWIQKKRRIRLYPNLYVCLVAKSGLRKSFAPNLANKIVAASEMTKVMVDRGSIQAIEQDLANVHTFPGSGKMISDAHGFFCSEELNASIINDPASQKMLTTWYDSNYANDKVTGTKRDGKAKLKNFYFSMFTATNQDHLHNFLDETSISGGFIARTLIIYATKKAGINSLIAETEEEGEGEDESFDVKPYADFLRECGNLKGRFRLDNSFRHAWNIWYQEFNKGLEEQNSDITGISERLHDHILKVAMCLAIADNHGMTITEKIFEDAKDMVIETAGDTQRVTAGSGKSDLSQKFKILMSDLLDARDYQISRRKILSKRYGWFDSSDLDKMVETLSQSGAVEVIRTNDGPIYQLSDSYIKQFEILVKDRKAL